MEKHRIIEPIENGVVIDHISQGKVWKVAQILRVGAQTQRVSLADNCESIKMPGKGILKLENFYPSDKELNLISLVAPEATVSLIEMGIVSSKRKVILPPVLEGIVPCGNHNCISNQLNEKIFSKIYFRNGRFLCHFCRYGFNREEIKI